MRALVEVIEKPSTQAPVDEVTIGVIITTYNHAHFLDDAIGSVLAQTWQADEIIVVDDGSTDDVSQVVSRYPSVRLIRQDNKGLAGARNTGWRNCATTHVVFLDADDLLLPHALECGVTFWSKHPHCALVYGGHRYVSETLAPMGGDIFFNVGEDAHRDFILSNCIGMHATVLYQRKCLEETGGFDESLQRCEDHDLYLRIASNFPIAGYPVTVAQYRRHENSMTADRDRMLRAVLQVLDRHEARLPNDPSTRAAIKEGRARWRALYAKEMLAVARADLRSGKRIGPVGRQVVRAVAWSPAGATRAIVREIGRGLRQGLRRMPVWRRPSTPRPAPGGWGFDKGTPIDRYYIEGFLEINSGDISGRVLEVGDNHYTLRFGGPAVEKSDILFVDDSNPRATIVGDLADSVTLPEQQFDCIILTQTLHLLFDVRAGVATLHRALKPGGILLLTVPGISPVGRENDWGNTWCWSLTTVSVRRLLDECFGTGAVHVEAHGNLDAAVAFLQQRVIDDTTSATLDQYDPCYPIIVAARAVKAADQ